ncbi:MAG: sulfotransferase [Flammeovirgaceae bacterium]|nr:sulfotransferase [Flammeovirgaceae bacterium]
MKKISHVVVLGCGRSGTSIFGELFEHIPQFTYYSEPPFKDLKRYDYSQPIAIKVPKESPGYISTPGLSFPLEELKNVLPKPKQLYWIVRHPLDAICSLRIGISKNWGHHPKPADWQDWLSKPLLEQCAYHWNYLNTVGYNQIKDLVQVVHFEDMLNDPLAFANAVADDIGLVLKDNKKALKDWANRVQNTNNEKFIEAKTSREYSRKDHNVRISRWKENLKEKEVEQIKPIIAEGAGNFGYGLDN